MVSSSFGKLKNTVTISERMKPAKANVHNDATNAAINVLRIKDLPYKEDVGGLTKGKIKIA